MLAYHLSRLLLKGILGVYILDFSFITMSFGFGNSNAALGNAPAPSAPGGFSFGGAASGSAPASGGGFSFGGAGAPPAATGGVPSFGSAAPPPAAGGFGFGSDAPAPANSSFGFGGAGAQAPASSGIDFNAGASATSTGGFGFGGPSTTAPAPGGGFSFGGDGPSESALNNFGNASLSAPATSGFGFGTSATDGKPASIPTGGTSFGSAGSTGSSVLNSGSGGNTQPAGRGFSFGPNSSDAASDPLDASSSKRTQSIQHSSESSGGFGFSGGDEQKSAKRAGFDTGDSNQPRIGDAINPSFGGFNAGESTTKKRSEDSESKPSSASTFGFGGGGNSTSTTPSISIPTTPGPPAPVATPAQHSQQQLVDNQTAREQSQPNQPLPLEYQTLSVEQILNKFQKELEKDAVVYLEEARRVAEYDAILRDANRDIALLTQKTHRCLLQQKDVEQTLSGIGAFQEELDRTLETVEQNVDELFRNQSHFTPVDADIEREKAYTTASDIESRLGELTQSLKTTLQVMDDIQDRVLTGDFGKVVKILNQHQNSIVELEDAGRRVEQEIIQINQLMEQR